MEFDSGRCMARNKELCEMLIKARVDVCARAGRFGAVQSFLTFDMHEEVIPWKEWLVWLGERGVAVKNDKSGHFCMSIYLELGHSGPRTYLVGRIEIYALPWPDS